MWDKIETFLANTGYRNIILATVVVIIIAGILAAFTTFNEKHNKDKN